MSLDIAQYALEEAKATESIWGGSKLHTVIEHWSPSSFSMLRRCPYQWQQRYIRKIKSRPAEAPVTGTTVHTALERNFDAKITSHEDIPMQELLEWYMDVGFPTVVVDEEEKTGSDILWDTGPEASRRRGRAMLAEYHATVSPRIQPLAVEQRVEVNLGLTLPVIGYFDVLREESVVDFKSGKKKRTVPKEDWRVQAAVYGEALGRPVEFHTMSATAANVATIVTPLESEALLVALSAEELRQMQISLRALHYEASLYLEVYGPDIDWPTHGRFHDWACNYCGYRDHCPAWTT